MLGQEDLALVILWSGVGVSGYSSSLLLPSLSFLRQGLTSWSGTFHVVQVGLEDTAIFLLNSRIAVMYPLCVLFS